MAEPFFLWRAGRVLIDKRRPRPATASDDGVAALRAILRKLNHLTALADELPDRVDAAIAAEVESRCK